MFLHEVQGSGGHGEAGARTGVMGTMSAEQATRRPAEDSDVVGKSH